MIGRAELERMTDHPLWATLQDEVDETGGLAVGSSAVTHAALGLDEAGVFEFCFAEAEGDLRLMTGLPETMEIGETLLQIHAAKVVAMVATAYHMGLIGGILLANERELAS